MRKLKELKDYLKYRAISCIFVGATFGIIGVAILVLSEKKSINTNEGLIFLEPAICLLALGYFIGSYYEEVKEGEDTALICISKETMSVLRQYSTIVYLSCIGLLALLVPPDKPDIAFIQHVISSVACGYFGACIIVITDGMCRQFKKPQKKGQE